MSLLKWNTVYLFGGANGGAENRDQLDYLLVLRNTLVVVSGLEWNGLDHGCRNVWGAAVWRLQSWEDMICEFVQIGFCLESFIYDYTRLFRESWSLYNKVWVIYIYKTCSYCIQLSTSKCMFLSANESHCNFHSIITQLHHISYMLARVQCD